MFETIMSFRTWITFHEKGSGIKITVCSENILGFSQGPAGTRICFKQAIDDQKSILTDTKIDEFMNGLADK